MVKNKNGILMPETLKIILAVMGIFLLVYLMYSFYGMFVKTTALKQAEVSLEIIYSEIEKVKGGKEEVEVLLESPKGWWIVAWPHEEKRNEKPIQCKTDYCVCICELKCGDEKKTYCKEVSAEIKTKGVIGDSSVQINPLSPIKIYKEIDKIVVEGKEFTKDVQ